MKAVDLSPCCGSECCSWTSRISSHSLCIIPFFPPLTLTVFQLPDRAIRIRPGQSVGQQSAHRLGLPSTVGAAWRRGCLLCLQAILWSSHTLLQPVWRPDHQPHPHPHPRSGSELWAGSVRGRPIFSRSSSTRQGDVVGHRPLRHTAEQELAG